MTSAFQSEASSTLLRALTLIRQTLFANQFVSAVSTSSTAILLDFDSKYYVGQDSCTFIISSDDVCICSNSYVCHISAGVFNVTMPIEMPEGCTLNVSINDSLTIFDGLFVGCIPVESLLVSTLACFYKDICLETLNQYLTINKTISLLKLPVQGQFTEESTIESLIKDLFVHQWKVNTTYDAFFNTCAPSVCSCTNFGRATFIYIIVTLIGFYGGVTVALQFLVVQGIKLRQAWNERSLPTNHGMSSDHRYSMNCIS